jgi:serine/threonine-protein phosphatase CPPED1
VKFKSAFLLVIFFIFAIHGIGQEQPYYFVMLADPQIGMYESNKGFSRETANYEFAVATVNRLKPAFVIVLGDLINKDGDAAQLHEFKRISKKISPSIPIHYVAGNHDVGHEPTPELLAAYRKKIGPDYYSFRAGPIYGIVLNSALIYEPKKVKDEYEKQNSWLKRELETAKASRAPQIIVFQHHPYFLKEADESPQYWTIPMERRRPLLELFHSYGVHYIFAGHIHNNSIGKDGDLEMVGTGPVGMPFGEDGSGIRLASATAAGVQHRYFYFGKMPDKLSLK